MNRLQSDASEIRISDHSAFEQRTQMVRDSGSKDFRNQGSENGATMIAWVRKVSMFWERKNACFLPWTEQSTLPKRGKKERSSTEDNSGARISEMMGEISSGP